MKPYVYVSTGRSRDISRKAPDGARIAIHYPKLGRSVELTADGKGRWTLAEVPAPTHGGEWTTIASGSIIAE